MAEYINITEFALRCHVDGRRVKLAINAKIIDVFERGQGGGPKAGYRICWDTEHKKFMKWCGEARLAPKSTWTKGTIDPIRKNAVEETTDVEEKDDNTSPPVIGEDATDEQLMQHLSKNISSIEADRIRKILRARRELLEYKKQEGILVDVSEFKPMFRELAVSMRKGFMAIPPRVSTQYAAITDHFKIKKHLEKELEIALSTMDRFVKKLEK